MKIIKATELTTSQQESIRQLWNREYPESLVVNPEAFKNFLNGTTGHQHFMILDDENEIIGWAYIFNREGDRWFSILIDELYQGIGLGRTLMNLLKEKEKRLNGWMIDHNKFLKQNGKTYKSPLNFYVKNGFSVYPDVRYSDGKIDAVKISWEKMG